MPFVQLFDFLGHFFVTQLIHIGFRFRCIQIVFLLRYISRLQIVTD